MDLTCFWLPSLCPLNPPLYFEVNQNQIATSLDRKEREHELEAPFSSRSQKALEATEKQSLQLPSLFTASIYNMVRVSLSP